MVKYISVLNGDILSETKNIGGSNMLVYWKLAVSNYSILSRYYDRRIQKAKHDKDYICTTLYGYFQVDE